MPIATYSRGEEIANSLTHGVGLLLSVAGLAVLVTFAALRGDAWAVTASAIFGASLVVLYTSSTLYHALRAPRLKQAVRIVDHVAIFLLIAGTYTPFMLVNLRGPWGWSLFGVIWALAAAGVTLKLFFTGRFRVLSTLVYLFMGWLVVVAFKPLVAALPRDSLIMLFSGGLAYSLGTVFYLWKRLPYHHAVWHLFVLAGSVCHFFAVFGSIA
ncbi:MAG TPA: hemolysin III family protein [Opitutaceae bacterium]|jgi:hemolysin III|nr:hemolysin III family protein [Opitutaceae bacterium]